MKKTIYKIIKILSATFITMLLCVLSEYLINIYFGPPSFKNGFITGMFVMLFWDNIF